MAEELREAGAHGHPRLGRRADAGRASRRAEQHREGAKGAARIC